MPSLENGLEEGEEKVGGREGLPAITPPQGSKAPGIQIGQTQDT